MSDINKVLASLDKVKSVGTDKWNALCPAHDDHSPSLSISLKDDRVLFKCWSGCGGVEIMESLNLPMQCFAPEGVLNGSIDGMQSVFGPKPKAAISTDECIIAAARADRKAGKRLTAAEKELEMQAHLKLIKNNN